MDSVHFVYCGTGGDLAYVDEHTYDFCSSTENDSNSAFFCPEVPEPT